jgi:hypothetical protein
VKYFLSTSSWLSKLLVFSILTFKEHDKNSRSILEKYFFLGPIAIDQVDPQGNFIVIENAGSTGKDQELKGWTLRRKIDAQSDIVYKFPDNFVLKSRSRIRILSRNASKGTINEKETLVAEGVQTWGAGTNMVTRLLDANGEEKALFNQKFQ